MYQAHARELLNQKESGNSPEMADSSTHPLFVATKRLVTALDGLEKRIGQVAVDRKEAERAVAAERENAELKREHEKLNNAISTLQHQYDDLHKAAGTIYNKLEDSIKRLTQIIEH